MSLLQQIDNDLKEALKAGQKERLSVLRGLKSDIKYKQIELGHEMSDADVIGVLTSASKKRKESIEQFKAGGRQDLVAKEEAEFAVIQTYLPEQLSEDKLRQIIKETIAETGANNPKMMGVVMKALLPKVKGMADGKLVSQLVTELLAN